MGVNYIINESQVELINILAEEQLKPSESTFVKNSNPFNKGFTKLNQFGIYSPEMKNGSLFYEVKREKIINFVLPKLKQSLMGKSFRWVDSLGDEQIFKFTSEMKYEVGVPLEYRYFFDYGYGFIPTYLSRVEISNKKPFPNESFFRYVPQVNFITINGRIYPNQKVISESTKDALLKTIHPIIRLSTLPEDCFELRRLQRQKTDF